MTEKVIPGTVLPYSDSGDSMFSFFRPMIKATDGLSLGQVCAITGLEVSTIQNWVKRGFVAHPVKKKYYERHFARILLITALRDSMRIEQIGELMTAVNGDTEDVSDDIISEPELYDCLCRCVRELNMFGAGEDEVLSTVEKVIKEYSGADSAVIDRLSLALTVMVTAYISTRMKKESEVYFAKLRSL